MKICREIDFSYLTENSWSGAIDTLNTIGEHMKEDELMDLLEEVFEGDIPTATEVNDFLWTKVNDFLWFEDEYIFEALGIKDEDEEDEDEEEDEESEEE